jgi:hypothetical protein
MRFVVAVTSLTVVLLLIGACGGGETVTPTPTPAPTPSPTPVPSPQLTGTEAEGLARQWLNSHDQIYSAGTIVTANGCDVQEYSDSTDEWLVQCDILFREHEVPTPRKTRSTVAVDAFTNAVRLVN